MTKTTNLTIAEFGAQARLSPKVVARMGSASLARQTNEQVGLQVLTESPKYWAVITPAVRRLHGIIDRSLEGGGFLDETRINNTSGHITNAVREATAINTISVIADATSVGLPVDLHKEVLAHPHRLKARNDDAAVEHQIEIGRRQLELDTKSANYEIDFQLMERVANLKVGTELALEEGRIRNTLALEGGRATIGLEAAKTANMHRLEHLQEVRRALADLRVEQEETRTNPRLTEAVRVGQMNDLEVLIKRLEAELRA